MRAWKSLKTSFGCFIVFPFLHKKSACFVAPVPRCGEWAILVRGACAARSRVSVFGARRRARTFEHSSNDPPAAPPPAASLAVWTRASWRTAPRARGPV
ncbi:hypothetical protein F6X42_26240 [Paraburkholderia sp. WC7.3b]|uniref:Secreted protein n=1 Tax=Paraburkholderia podalyriae TaxID=1938811 RepID=A0ABR7PUK9_9BURK|nr:hypothetical protein [Paraburkholderia podalyriae]